MELISKWEIGSYKQVGKHRKKCRRCGKLIDDGVRVTAFKEKKKEYYPIKGIKEFIVYHFEHVECGDKK